MRNERPPGYPDSQLNCNRAGQSVLWLYPPCEKQNLEDPNRVNSWPSGMWLGVFRRAVDHIGVDDLGTTRPGGAAAKSSRVQLEP